jgi:uncharacterized membrane protein
MSGKKVAANSRAETSRAETSKDLEIKRSPIEIDIQDPFETELAKRVGSIVPKGQKDQVLAQILSVVREERFSGPIAHPKHLREYEEICPGAADRIIAMAEKELSAQAEFSKAVIDAEINDRRFGMRAGLLSFAMLILSAAICAVVGKEVLAAAFLGAAALGVVGKFVDGRRKSSSETSSRQ